MSREYRYCGTCDFWQPDKAWSGKVQTGQCRRYAPTTLAGWPATDETLWCGDFEPSGLADAPFDDASSEGGQEATVTYMRGRR
jgi:hypothetical protein